jgi:hypothetical protein
MCVDTLETASRIQAYEILFVNFLFKGIKMLNNLDCEYCLQGSSCRTLCYSRHLYKWFVFFNFTGYVWTLVFSTSQHGFSLNSMYRKMNRLESPILMVIEDTEHNVSATYCWCRMYILYVPSHTLLEEKATVS